MGIEEYVKMEGKEEGLKIGRKEGAQKKSYLFVKNLLTSTRFSVKKIASLACVTETFVKKVQKDLAIPPSGKIYSR
jgi:predicted transposase YdaD